MGQSPADKHILDNGLPIADPHVLIDFAAVNNKIELLKYLRSKGFGWGTVTLSTIAGIAGAAAADGCPP